MKKTFPLHLPEKSDTQVLAAIQVTLNKYVKRERRKALPEGAGRWGFQCRVGKNHDEATPCELAEIPARLEALSQASNSDAYVEILAEPLAAPAPKPTPPAP